jgi:hypothetical protein
MQRGVSGPFYCCGIQVWGHFPAGFSMLSRRVAFDLGLGTRWKLIHYEFGTIYIAPVYNGIILNCKGRD